MDIIKTKLVNPANDVMWEEVTELASDAAGKPVLVLVNEFGDGEEVQLKKMLDATKLPAEKFHIIKLKNGQTVAWHKLRATIDPKVVFLIGILPAQLGISALFNLNHPNNFDGRIWLPTLSLGELARHEDMKKQLWLSGMKPVLADNIYGIL